MYKFPLHKDFPNHFIIVYNKETNEMNVYTLQINAVIL
jgi:hypothetical protein